MNRKIFFRLVICVLFASFTGFLFQGQASGSAIKDTESASHADTAATQVIANTYEYEGVKIVQFNLAVL